MATMCHARRGAEGNSLVCFVRLEQLQQGRQQHCLRRSEKHHFSAWHHVIGKQGVCLQWLCLASTRRHLYKKPDQQGLQEPHRPPCRSPAVAYQIGDGSRTVKNFVHVSMKGILTTRRPELPVLKSRACNIQADRLATYRYVNWAQHVFASSNCRVGFGVYGCSLLSGVEFVP
jgi:hypothetical protein